jgi:hypothetical protein
MQYFLDTVAWKTLNNFLQYLPRSGSHTWLILDTVDQLSVDMTVFFQALIQVSYKSSKFELSLFTHMTEIACSVFQWSNGHSPIKIVKQEGGEWSKKYSYYLSL